MFSKLQKQISVVLLISIVLLTAVGYIAYLANRRTLNALKWEQHTREIIQKLDELLILSLNIETSSRGFVIAGEENFLEPFNSSGLEKDSVFDELNKFIADNPSQIVLSGKLKTKLDEKIAFGNKLVEYRKAGNAAESMRLIQGGAGKTIMDEIRSLIVQMKDNERQLLAARENDLRAGLNRSLMILLGSLVFGISMLGLANFVVRREINARFGVEDKLRQANLNLEKNIAERTEKLSESEKFSRAILDSMDSHIAVIDREGKIIAINKGWEDFSKQNSSEEQLPTLGVGQNYLTVCEKVNVDGEKNLTEKIKSVIAGERQSFTFEYPCHSPDERRWFLMQVSGFNENDGAVISHINITKRKIAEIELQNKEEFNRAVIENSPDCVKVLESDGRLISMNSNGMCLMEIDDFTPFVGKNWTDNWQNEEHELAKKSVEVALKGETFFFEGACSTAKGTPKWWEVTVSPIFDVNRKVSRLLVTSRDVTERRNAELEREKLLKNEQQARREAEVATRLREEFMATVSHELRTPLNSILGWARLLKSGKAQGATGEKAVETIIRSAEAQNILIEDLLDVGRMVSGKLVLDKIEIPAEEIAKQPLEMVRPNAQAKSIELNLNVAENVKDKKIFGDPNRIRQIILNLLNNAVKFTPENGKIVLDLTAADEKILVKVTDSGIGIKPEFLPHVFQRFRQDSETLKQSGGLGLGLAIVRHLTEMHGGSVAVESEGINKGAVFTITFPVFEKTTMPSLQR